MLIFDCFETRNDTDILVTSPQLYATNTLTTDQPLPLTLTVQGEVVANDAVFVYKPNPVISDVHPLETIAAYVPGILLLFKRFYEHYTIHSCSV